jgi:hypothetical protein
MKLLLIDDEGTLRKTYHVGHDERVPIAGNFDFVLPMMMIKQYPMSAGNAIGSEIVENILELHEQGIK